MLLESERNLMMEIVWMRKEFCTPTEHDQTLYSTDHQFHRSCPLLLFFLWACAASKPDALHQG